MPNQLTPLGLRGKSIEELRILARKYLQISPDDLSALDKPSIMSLLSSAISKSDQLAIEIRKAQIAFKPSFYLMILGLLDKRFPSKRTASEKLRKVLEGINLGLAKRGKHPPYANFKLEKLVEHDSKVIEIHVSWERIHWYWRPSDVSMAHIYELQFGFIIIDPQSRKTMIACHTEFERKTLDDLVCSIYPISMSTLVLTKPILDQIGTYDHVRRAGYFLPEEHIDRPSNITYADENLGIKAIARSQEDDPSSIRKHTFYHIPLGSIEEQGVGATTDTGKLWIPRELPLDAIRDFGVELLRKVGATLDSMTEKGEYDDVLSSMGIPRLPIMQQIKKAALREETFRLVRSIANMLLSNETSRAFTISDKLVTNGVPSLFQYPRLIIHDPESNEYAFWKDEVTGVNQVQVKLDGRVKVIGHPSGQTISLSSLRHPISGNRVSVSDPISSLHLLPTTFMHEAILKAINHISSQIPDLAEVSCIPFYISGNALHLNVNRAFGRSGLSRISSRLLPQDVLEFRPPLRVSVPTDSRDAIQKSLNDLGEECTSSSDKNCASCLQDNKYICLRSLVARYVKSPLLLPHKSIELSDLQARISIAGDEQRLFAFAKQGRGKIGLTARNEPGAKLLAQVLGQVDKTTFDIVAIVSSSTLNEDLVERLSMVSGLLNKHLMLLDYDTLAHMLVHFEEQSIFEKRDPNDMYKRSRKKKQKKKAA
jgi:hypothetical protein